MSEGPRVVRLFRSAESMKLEMERRKPAYGLMTDARETKHAGIVKTLVVCSDAAMSQPFARPSLYKGYR